MVALKKFLELSMAAARDERQLFNSLSKRTMLSTFAEVSLNEIAEQWRQISESPDTPVDKRMYAHNRYEFCAHPTTKNLVMARCRDK